MTAGAPGNPAGSSRTARTRGSSWGSGSKFVMGEADSGVRLPAVTPEARRPSLWHRVGLPLALALGVVNLILELLP